MIPNVLSIAGFDPSGGAGIAADLKTFAALRCYGMAAVTALTAQNTQGVRAVHVPPPDFVAAQIDATFDDIEVAAVKIGMLAAPAIVEVVAERLAHHKPRFIVLDPVLESTSGDSLATADTAGAIVRHLFPLVTLVTPNIFEAARLSGQVVAGDFEGMRRAAIALHGQGARAVLVKGGHIAGPTSDDLFLEDKSYRLFSAPRVETRSTHGTGCASSSAIAAFLARGFALEDAIGAAKTYLSGALAAAGALSAGKAAGPLNHFHDLWASQDGTGRVPKPRHLL